MIPFLYFVVFDAIVFIKINVLKDGDFYSVLFFKGKQHFVVSCCVECCIGMFLSPIKCLIRHEQGLAS